MRARALCPPRLRLPGQALEDNGGPELAVLRAIKLTLFETITPLDQARGMLLCRHCYTSLLLHPRGVVLPQSPSIS